MRRHGKSSYCHQERALHCIRKKTLENLCPISFLVSINKRAWSKARDINGSFEKLKDFISWDFCRIKMTLNRLNPYCNTCKICLADLSWRVNGTESCVVVVLLRAADFTVALNFWFYFIKDYVYMVTNNSYQGSFRGHFFRALLFLTWLCSCLLSYPKGLHILWFGLWWILHGIAFGVRDFLHNRRPDFTRFLCIILKKKCENLE